MDLGRLIEAKFRLTLLLAPGAPAAPTPALTQPTLSPVARLTLLGPATLAAPLAMNTQFRLPRLRHGFHSRRRAGCSGPYWSTRRLYVYFQVMNHLSEPQLSYVAVSQTSVCRNARVGLLQCLFGAFEKSLLRAMLDVIVNALPHGLLNVV